MPNIDRRTLLAGSAAMLATRPALAASPKATVQGPGVYRTRLGDYQLTAIDDGTWFLKIDGDFVRNAGGDAVNRALAEAEFRVFFPQTDHALDGVQQRLWLAALLLHVDTLIAVFAVTGPIWFDWTIPASFRLMPNTFCQSPPNFHR